MGDEDMTGREVVVALDGTEGSLAALRWAIGYSELTGNRLVVLHAYRPESDTTDARVRIATESVHRAQATGWLRHVLDDRPSGRTPVRLELVAGDWGRVVGRYAAGRADLVVLGMGQEVLHYLDHLAVPVVLVPAPTQVRPPGTATAPVEVGALRSGTA